MLHQASQVRAALSPLVNAMQQLPEGDRAAWLHDLRSDAPTVVATLEALLQEDVAPNARAPRLPGLRRFMALFLA